MFKMIPIQYRILIAVALLLALVWGSYQKGWQHAVDRVTAVQAKAKAKADKQQVKQASAVQAVAVQNASAIERTRVVYKTVTKEVVKYAQSKNAVVASGVCDQRLDAEWVRIHDLAADPDPAASAPAQSAEPVGKADALGVVSRNYETCQLWRNQLIGWQAWWTVQINGVSNE